MQKQQHNTLLWTLWSPLKFAASALILMLTITFVYVFGSLAFYGASTVIPQSHIITYLIITLVFCVAYQIRHMPRDKMSQASFVSIHNAQTFILSALFLCASYFLAKYAQQILLNLILMGSNLSVTFILITVVASLLYLYLTGLFIANIYAKYLRARALKIPTWKFLFSIPFGFSAIWVPGYFLDTDTTNNKTVKSTNWYAKITNWSIARPINTILSFIFISTLSGFFFGFNSVLLTFCLTLIFGLWYLQIGSKNFIKNINKRYSTMAVIINIALIVILSCFSAFVPVTTQNVQINISDTQTLTLN